MFLLLKYVIWKQEMKRDGLLTSCIHLHTLIFEISYKFIQLKENEHEK